MHDVTREQLCPIDEGGPADLNQQTSGGPLRCSNA